MNNFAIAITCTTSNKTAGQFAGTRLAAMPDIRLDGQSLDILAILGQAYKLEVVTHSTGYHTTTFVTSNEGSQVVVEENDHTGRVDIKHYPFGVVVPDTAQDKSEFVSLFLEQVTELRTAVLGRAGNVSEDNYWFDENQEWHAKTKA